jgi:uncharacterized protein
MSTSVSTYLNRTTPGVYITEIAAFGNSIVGVPTAVPIFIGYTQFAGDPTTGASLYNTPVEISSMTEYLQFFGGPAVTSYTVTPVQAAAPPSGSSGGSAAGPTPAFYANFTSASGSGSGSGSGGSVASVGFTVQPAIVGPPPAPTTYGYTPSNNFNLYWMMQLFFANGGGNCYIVSVGSYWSGETPTSTPNPVGWPPGTIEAGSIAPLEPGLLVGLQAASYAIGPTMIVIPEACQLDFNDYQTVVQAMMTQATTLQDRVAILDLPGAMEASTLAQLQQCQTNLATTLAFPNANLSYACAYAPALNTSIVSTNSITFASLQSTSGEAGNETMNNILTTQAVAMYGPQLTNPMLVNLQAAIASAFPTQGEGTNTAQYSLATQDTSGNQLYPVAPAPGTAALTQWQLTLDNLLNSALPVYAQVKQVIVNTMNVAPPSGILAGIWAANDASRGVWNAPANFPLASVVSPLYQMSDSEQGGFNVPLNGQAIDIIRAQPGRGNVVWGARTLDGNSMDYRYIQVRRTLIYIEQSIKFALQSYVFAANDATTWTTVTAAISGFLTGVWQQGGLMGAKPTDAFTVSCGLGTTMTAQNILNGYMIVAITLQLIHPAEFIELTFTQTMGT